MLNDHIRRHDRRFSRYNWHDSPFQKGDLKYVVLDLLKEKPRYGYEIIRNLEEQSQGFYTPSPGVVYPTLQMLDEMGYATSQERDGKKIFTITDEGIAFLAERKDSADEVRSQIRKRWCFSNPGRIASVMKEYSALEYLVRGCVRRLDADKSQKVSGVLSSAYKEIENILEN